MANESDSQDQPNSQNPAVESENVTAATHEALAQLERFESQTDESVENEFGSRDADVSENASEMPRRPAIRPVTPLRIVGMVVTFVAGLCLTLLGAYWLLNVTDENLDSKLARAFASPPKASFNATEAYALLVSIHAPIDADPIAITKSHVETRMALSAPELVACANGHKSEGCPQPLPERPAGVSPNNELCSPSPYCEARDGSKAREEFLATWSVPLERFKKVIAFGEIAPPKLDIRLPSMAIGIVALSRLQMLEWSHRLHMLEQTPAAPAVDETIKSADTTSASVTASAQAAPSARDSYEKVLTEMQAFDHFLESSLKQPISGLDGIILATQMNNVRKFVVVASRYHAKFKTLAMASDVPWVRDLDYRELAQNYHVNEIVSFQEVFNGPKNQLMEVVSIADGPETDTSAFGKVRENFDEFYNEHLAARGFLPNATLNLMQREYADSLKGVDEVPSEKLPASRDPLIENEPVTDYSSFSFRNPTGKRMAKMLTRGHHEMNLRLRAQVETLNEPVNWSVE